MLYRRLADVVVLIHCVVAVYFFLGALLALRYPWTAAIHVPLALWISMAFVMGWTCPLTPLEIHLRKAAGGRGYEGSFVDHYLGACVGLTQVGQEPAKIGRRGEIIAGVLLCMLTILPHAANIGLYHDAIWPPAHPPAAPAAEPPITSLRRVPGPAWIFSFQNSSTSIVAGATDSEARLGERSRPCG